MCMGRRVRSGSGVSITSIHATDQRVQEESAEEEEKEAEKKLPGQHLSFQTHTGSRFSNISCYVSIIA